MIPKALTACQERLENRLKALNQVKVEREERYSELKREIDDLRREIKPPSPKHKNDVETNSSASARSIESDESRRRLRRAEDVFNETLRQEAAKLNMTVDELTKVASGLGHNELPVKSNRHKSQLW